ncbi:hypothetical protein UZ36_04715 [Candidatus Nitromaritima sp. SCGC AAA799-C22]|nr:hypothetical protein UZ36_04715 [Candidatus Nitromaritima sp. SCGC AAA799-C22]
METITVPGIVLKHLKRSQLPATWRKSVPADPDTRFRVAVDPEGAADEDGLLRAELLPATDEQHPSIAPMPPSVAKRTRMEILAKLARKKGQEDSAEWIATIKAGRAQSELKIPLS